VLAQGEISLGWVAAFYLVLFGLTFYGGHLRARITARTEGHPLSSTVLPGAALLGLSLVTVLVWRSALLAPDSRKHLTVLDVGSRDALLSVAAGDRRGNPAVEVIEALEGITLLRTDQHDSLHLRFLCL
jgi:hypothetical protein